MNSDCALNITDLNIVLSNFGQSGDVSAHRMLVWDAENRLIRVEPSSPVSGNKKVEYTYDYLGRRVQRKVFTHNGTSWPSTPDEDSRFVYYNWLPLIEFDGLNSNAVLRRWTWGLDLAGLNGSQNSIDQAGGIGGLLATYDTSGSKAYIYFHDGNGNVGQLIDPLASTASASLVARYEYDAYGNVTSSGGSYAATNRMRFSTKPWDAVTDLGYWGYRWYSARLGRWAGRDPVGENGGPSLFGYCRNAPAARRDPFGLNEFVWTKCKAECAASFGFDPNDWQALQDAYDHNMEFRKCVDGCLQYYPPPQHPALTDAISKSDAVLECWFDNRLNSISCHIGNEWVTCNTVCPPNKSCSQRKGPTPPGEYAIGTYRIHPTHQCGWFNLCALDRQLFRPRKYSEGHPEYPRNLLGLHPGGS